MTKISKFMKVTVKYHGLTCAKSCPQLVKAVSKSNDTGYSLVCCLYSVVIAKSLNNRCGQCCHDFGDGRK